MSRGAPGPTATPGSADMHTHAEEWDADKVVWYLDGEVPDGLTFPQELAVDWVRVYA